MKIALFRAEPGRYGLSPKCSGDGVVLHSGLSVRYRGVDVSQRGFGCVITGSVETGDQVQFSFAGKHITFQVMWSESHLGIENMHRVGLTPLDPEVNLEHIMRELDFVEHSVLKAS